MNLGPSQDDVVELLKQTGALRKGHFAYPNGLHSEEYLAVALAMRYFQHAKTLSVGLSRLIRANSELRAMIPELSVVAPATGGLPVAYGMCEALPNVRIRASRCGSANIWNRWKARRCYWWTISSGPAIN